MFEQLRSLFNKREQGLSEKDFESIIGGYSAVKITEQDAMNIPSVAACVEFISSTIAGLPIKLYKKNGEDVREITDDYRLKLLNDETGDLLSASDWKKSIVIDYLLFGNGYSYVKKRGNKIVSLNYVETNKITAVTNNEPIEKDAYFLVNGKKIDEFNMFRILKQTKDGVTGIGVIERHPLFLSMVHNALKYENNAISYGSKRGFLQSKYRLTDQALSELKSAWKKLYSTEVNNKPDVMVLNEGVTFESASSTAVENQMNESKQSNNDMVCEAFNLPPAIFATVDNDYRVFNNAVKMAIMPITKLFNASLNKFMLLESEKRENYFFAFDESSLLRSTMVEQYQAYEIALKSGWLQVDEVRQKENMKPLGLDFVKLSLADVLYYPDKKEVYTANTNETYIIGKGNANTKGGETDENRNPSE